jgi:hypothetical protein
MFGSAETLVQRRRATYSAILELMAGEAYGGADPDILDSPAARAHLGQVVAGGVKYRSAALTPVSTIANGAAAFRSDLFQIHVVSDPEARLLLEGAVRHIAAELGAPSDGVDGIRLLLDGEPRFANASRNVVNGLKLATTICPELAEDLLPHVCLFAVLANGKETGQLGSASARDFPGLVVVPEPVTELEVAEALVHEGGHQKFFDLAMVRSILGDSFCRAPSFSSSWAPTSAPRWPLEQCMAAFHAYTCLATFNEVLLDSAVRNQLHDFSLLPVAEERAAELGEWLLRNVQFLGRDGVRFVSKLAGAHEFVEDPPTTADVRLDHAAPTAVRMCDEWTLLAQRADRVELYWLPTAEVGSDVQEGRKVPFAMSGQH